MSITYFVLIVAVAAFCGGLAGSLVANAEHRTSGRKDTTSGRAANGSN